MVINFPLLVFAVSFVALVFSARIGDALRKKVPRSQEEGGGDFGVVLTGTLTLLGLVIGFSISMAIIGAMSQLGRGSVFLLSLPIIASDFLYSEFCVVEK